MMRKRPQSGLTLVEVMIAGTILTVISLSVLGVMGNLAKAITTSREGSLANHLAEEKLESLKALSFYAIMVTSSTPPNLDPNFNFPYDEGYYPPENVRMGGTTFTRKVFIEKAATPSGYVENVGYPHPDTGLKRITVYVTWQKKDNSWKKTSLSSLSSNPKREPLDINIFGYVTDSISGSPVDGAQVLNKRNPGQGAVTDLNGYYSFQTTDNSIRVISSRHGYNQYWSSSFNVNYGTNQFDFSMVALTTEVVSGVAMTYTNLVISQVNAKWSNTADSEFVEIYNASTTAVDLSSYSLVFVDKFGTQFNLTQLSTVSVSTIPGQGYYVYYGTQHGNDPNIPNGLTADAYYTAVMSHAQQGGLILTGPNEEVIDKVGWGSTTQQPDTSTVEGSFFDNGGSPGIDQGDTIIRLAVSTSTAVSMEPPFGLDIDKGNAWDGQNNSTDFVTIATASPRNTVSTTYAPHGGTVLSYAFVSGYDPVSGSTMANANGTFELSMEVGSWSIVAGSGSLMGTEALTVVSPGPNTVTIWVVDPATVAYITGNLIKYGGGALANIVIQADPGGYQDVSDSDGNFTFIVPADEDDDSYYLTANPDFQNPNWNTAVSADAIIVEPGEVSSGHQLSCWANSYVSGRITTNGVDGLPGIPVQALGQWSNGNSAITDAAGYYTIQGLRIAPNPYDVFPVLQDDMTSDPPSTNLNVVRGVNTTGIDFIVTGARLPISGQVLYNGNSIQSGVNIVASTSAVSSSNPPAITFSLRESGQRLYQAVTDGQGNYTLEVLGGETYYLVAWYTDHNGTTAKTSTVVVPSNTGVTGVNLSWP